jgi:hypothetical protein
VVADTTAIFSAVLEVQRGALVQHAAPKVRATIVNGHTVEGDGVGAPASGQT